MIHYTAAFDESRFYSKLIRDYLSGLPELRSFYQYPHRMESFEDAISERSLFAPEHRDLLVRVLEDDFERLGYEKSKYQETWNHIQLLRKSNTYTVTTGHQLCLLSGPLYFIIKIAHAIRLAEELRKRHPGQHFVPVFWLASEDHDFEEVRTVLIAQNSYIWDINSLRHPVGKLATHTLGKLFEQMRQELGEAYADVVHQMQSLYMQSDNLSDATHRLVSWLFGTYGIVVLDADRNDLKKQLIPVMTEDILNETSIQALNQTNAVLAKNYKLQVNGRACNFFYIHQGQRLLIEKKKDLYQLQDSDLHWTAQELQDEIHNHPEKFSPNVILRPVYQEMILPNLAYIGGPGEIAYWLQLKQVFASHQVFFPMLCLRNSLVPVDTHTNRIIKKLNMAPADVFLPIDESLNKVKQKLLPTFQNELIDEVNQVYQQLIDSVGKMDNQLQSDLIQHKLKVQKELKHWSRLIQKAKNTKLESEIQTWNQVIAGLFPNRVPSERYYNLLHFSPNPQQTIQAILRVLDPVATGVHVVSIS